MSKNTKPRLQVVSREGHHYIMVPCEWAGDLRLFLRGKGVSSSPPEAVTKDLSSVALGKKTNAKVVQGILDVW